MSGIHRLLKLLHSCKDHFHFYYSSVVHIYDLYHMHIIHKVPSIKVKGRWVTCPLASKGLSQKCLELSVGST